VQEKEVQPLEVPPSEPVKLANDKEIKPIKEE